MCHPHIILNYKPIITHKSTHNTKPITTFRKKKISHVSLQLRGIAAQWHRQHRSGAACHVRGVKRRSLCHLADLSAGYDAGAGCHTPRAIAAATIVCLSRRERREKENLPTLSHHFTQLSFPSSLRCCSRAGSALLFFLASRHGEERGSEERDWQGSAGFLRRFRGLMRERSFWSRRKKWYGFLLLLLLFFVNFVCFSANLACVPVGIFPIVGEGDGFAWIWAAASIVSGGLLGCSCMRVINWGQNVFLGWFLCRAGWEV